ncbi:MAG TPA: HNH endonuclease signature motif containing protein [Nitrospirales bacterium]|nr:hypothetical protein [Nitrospiraceae bacterium]HNP31154.1 HNH endonuclease signature motif containing protein [Nitrospirales bacterium]
MGEEFNKYGLSRYIPENVRRQIRKESGFGCVICGGAFITYEHIDPTFAEAREHDPQKMTLLCWGCHGRVTKGVWSKDKVRSAQQAPITFRNGCANDAFDFRDPFELFLGNNHFQDVSCIVRKSSGEEWLKIEPPEDPEAPPRINAKFYGFDGLPDLEIIGNEWTCSTDVWDLRTEGNRIEVYKAKNQLLLRLKAKPPHGLGIQYLKMLFLDTGIEVGNDGKVDFIIKGKKPFNIDSSMVSGADSVFLVP